MTETKDSSTTAASSGISFTGALTVLFVGLKLTHYIDWSWLWVLSPLWMTTVLFVSIAVGVLVLAGVAAAVASIFTMWRK